MCGKFLSSKLATWGEHRGGFMLDTWPAYHKRANYSLEYFILEPSSRNSLLELIILNLILLACYLTKNVQVPKAISNFMKNNILERNETIIFLLCYQTHVIATTEKINEFVNSFISKDCSIGVR